MPHACRVVLACLAGSLAVAGCDSGPTYPKTQLSASLQKILQEDFESPSVRFIDHTLAVQLQQPDALLQHDGQIGIGPAFDATVRKLLMALHRVLLSSDAEVRFYVLLLADPNIPGAYLTMVRYVDDVRRANANMIDATEMFSRTIFELNYMGAAPLTLEQYLPRDIRLEEFLTWQMSRRIQQALATELQNQGGAKVGRCPGRFQNGEFAFTLDVAPAEDGALDEATVQQVFHTSTNVIAQVLSSYHFDAYSQIRLIHPSTGRNLVLPKATLDVFR